MITSPQDAARRSGGHLSLTETGPLALGEILDRIILVSATVYQQDSTPIWFSIISGLGSVLGAVNPAPLLAIAPCLIYYDARVRKEGFDLQRLLDEMPPAAPPDVTPRIVTG